MARAKSVLTFVTGVPGVGKSWRQVYYIIKEIIPDMPKDGILYTNLPLKKDEFASHFKDETLKERIVIISDEEQKLWRDSKKFKSSSKDNTVVVKIESSLKSSSGVPSYGASEPDYGESTKAFVCEESEEKEDDKPSELLGPWSYFKGKKTSNCVLILDEIHELCRNTDPQFYKDQWEEFLATVRHLGFMSVEFLTQAEAEVARVIKSRAGVKVSLEDNESELDPFFKIPLSDWYNLKAKYVGKYTKTFLESTYKKKDGRWSRKALLEIRRSIDSFYFRFYDSFNHTVGTTSTDKHEEKKPFQKHSFIGLHWWFIKRNCIALIYKLAICLFFLWVMSGGYKTILSSFIGGMSKSAITQQTKKTVENDTDDSSNVRENMGKKENKESIKQVPKVEIIEKKLSPELLPEPVPEPVPEPEPEPDPEKIVFISGENIMTDLGRFLSVGDKINDKEILSIDFNKRGFYDEDNNFNSFAR